MDFYIKEDMDDLGFRAAISADDGFEIEFHIDADKDEVSEIYFSGYDFPPEAPFLDSVYVIVDNAPISIRSLISEATIHIDDLRAEIKKMSQEQADYEAGKAFYFNHGRI